MDQTREAAHPTTQHIFIDKESPSVWRALNGLGLKAREAADEAGISRALTELLKQRSDSPFWQPGGTPPCSPRRNARPWRWPSPSPPCPTPTPGTARTATPGST
jgi:hypothetical protein